MMKCQSFSFHSFHMLSIVRLNGIEFVFRNENKMDFLDSNNRKWKRK